MKIISSKLDPVNMVKILLVGRSGVGKTYSLGRLKGLWYFTHEPDGVPVIRATNPDARIFQLEAGLKDYGAMKDMLFKVHAACSGGGCDGCRHTGKQCAADGCYAVGFDSLSEAQRLCLRHANVVNNKRRKSKLADGAFDELDYNLSYTYLHRLLEVIRSVPVPAFVLAHSQFPEPQVQTPTGEVVKYVRCHIPGKKFNALIPRYFTAIGCMRHKLGPPEKRAVVFDPKVVWDDYMFSAKSMDGLSSIEDADPQLWIDKISDMFAGKPRADTSKIELSVARPVNKSASKPSYIPE